MAEGFVRTLLSLSLSGACLAALAEGMARLLRDRVPPGLRRLLWLLVLARLLCPWSLSGGLLDRGAAELWEPAAQSAALEAGTHSQTEPNMDKIQEISISEQENCLPIYPALAALWTAGFLTMAARRGLDYARLCRALREGRRAPEALEGETYARLTASLRHPPELWVSSAAPCPMLVGLLRPRLILPELALSREELEGALSHELTHWRHRDLWIKWLAALGVCVHWFNPAVRLLAERLDRDSELYCDQTVAQNWDLARRARYGELLLRLAAGGQSPAAALFSQKQRLKERLTAMMDAKTYGKKAFALGAAACLTLALATTALGAYTGPAAVGEKLADLTQVSQPENTPKTLAWPLAAGEGAELSARFETRVHPITGETRSHTGVDLVQPEGTPVLAAADGAVVAVGFSQQYGNCVLLQHGNMTTRYAHLKEYTVQPGEAVSAGDPIGLVGRTGMATGAHLHFGVEVDGVPVDPMDYLPQA